MLRRLALVVVLTLAAAAPAAGTLASQQRSADSRLATLQQKIAAARAREARLTAEIGGVTTRIRALESRVGNVATRLSVLERDLALHRERLAKLTALFELQTRRLDFLRRQYQEAVDRLELRIVAIYESNDPDELDVLMSADSFGDLLDQVDYLDRVAQQDKRIAGEVHRARDEMRVIWTKTKKTKIQVAAATRTIAVRTAEQRDLRDRLLASQHALSGARRHKLRALAATQESEQEFISEVDAIRASSAALSAKIQAAQSSSTVQTPSSSGLIWPVQGPVTSPFGMRWGRMHTGIDIGVPYGTPIHAAAAGSVIYAGWMGGYGNLTVIDHGHGLATAYAHQSSFAVGVGANVSQGQVIGYVGCTGHCFGPHLHFEVRVNGIPVDPLGYLG